MRSIVYPAGPVLPAFPTATPGPCPASPVPVAPPADFPRLVGMLARLRWQAALRLPECPFDELTETSSAAYDASCELIRLCDGLGWSEAVYAELAKFPPIVFDE